MATKVALNQIEVVDLYVNVYPEIPWPKSLQPFKQKLAHWIRPFVKLQQQAQPLFHRIPRSLQSLTDEITIPASLPHLALESDIFDLAREMERNKVSQAAIVPLPPLSSNDFVFYESKRIEGAIPAVFIDPKTMRSAEDLKAFYNRGARLFVIDPLLSGVPIAAPYYKPFLSFLNQKKAPLIIHTGAISSRLFRLPKAGDISEYEDCIADYQDISFLAAHMNFHNPQAAITLAKKYKNLYLLTSWQSTETLMEAIKDLGADKLLFASHWPLLGENMPTQKERLYSLYAEGSLSLEGLSTIFSGNAKKILTASQELS